MDARRTVLQNSAEEGLTKGNGPCRSDIFGAPETFWVVWADLGAWRRWDGRDRARLEAACPRRFIFIFSGECLKLSGNAHPEPLIDC